jgi:hypothetical protein
MRRTYELGLGIATLLPIPIFLAFVGTLLADPPSDGEFPVLPAVLMVLWTAVNFLPAIILALDAHQHDPPWTVLLVVFGGFLTPVYYWTRRWPRVR